MAAPVRHKTESAAFLDFLRTPEARAVLVRFGFTEP